MKKTQMGRCLRILLILGLCACLLFAGCQKGERQEPETDTPGTEPPDQTVSYDVLAGIYRADIFMAEDRSVSLYLRISADGSFVFARDNLFADNEKGAGVLGKTEEGGDAFFYTVFNGEETEKGDYVSTYILAQDGSIQFTSPMWFGSTEPKYIDEDGSVTYPCFMPYDPSAQPTDPSAPEETQPQSSETVPTETTVPASTEGTKPTEPKATTPPTAATEPKATQPPTEATQPQVTDPPTQPPAEPVFKEGTYHGSFDKFVDMMGSDVHYDVTITFQNGNYQYTVKITLSGGMEYSGEENYSGSYRVSGDKITMTGNLSNGTISGSAITISGQLSSFASQQESITVYP